MLLQLKEQEEAMLSGLDRISYLLGFYRSWEKLYLEDSDPKFQENIVKLYTSILHYQARMLGYLSHHTIKRGLRKAFGSDSWTAWLDAVDACDKDCERFASLADVGSERENWDREYRQLAKQSDIAEQMLSALQGIRQTRLD